jgi:hypothetical protein
MADGSGSQQDKAKDKAARKKQYYAERTASRIYLLDEHTRWRSFMDELSLKSDKELASVLLDNYMAHKGRHFR